MHSASRDWESAEVTALNTATGLQGDRTIRQSLVSAMPSRPAIIVHDADHIVLPEIAAGPDLDLPARAVALRVVQLGSFRRIQLRKGGDNWVRSAILISNGRAGRALLRLFISDLLLGLEYSFRIAADTL
jgi:hypothetical protein